MRPLTARHIERERERQRGGCWVLGGGCWVVGAEPPTAAAWPCTQNWRAPCAEMCAAAGVLLLIFLPLVAVRGDRWFTVHGSVPHRRSAAAAAVRETVCSARR